jgi:hypothetical protein
VPFDIVHRTRVYVALVGKLSRNADDQGNEPVHVSGPIDPTVHVISSTVGVQFHTTFLEKINSV